VFGVFGDFLLSTKMDQTSCVKCCVKNVIKCSETFETSTVAYGDSTRKNVCKWYERFA